VSYFPLFINLEDLPCTAVGGGPVAARKIQTLLDFGGRLTVIDPEPSGALESLVLEQNVTLIRRTYNGPEDLEGARLLIAASGDREVNRRAAADAKALGIPVNAADDPEGCSFFFPAIVRRGDLVAGLSSSGLCPRITARLREELENSWPSEWAEALEYLGRERRRLREEEKKSPQNPKAPSKIVPVLDELITRLLKGEKLP
jgi:siroheme synthase-like protein